MKMNYDAAIKTNAGIVELQLHENNTYTIVRVTGFVQATLLTGVYDKDLANTVNMILDNDKEGRLIVIQE